jgi:hypothetical protein
MRLQLGLELKQRKKPEKSGALPSKLTHFERLGGMPSPFP